MKIIFNIFAIVFFVIGCEGPAGPTGPKGDTGDQGQAGEPFEWSSVIVEEQIEKCIYAITVQISGNTYLVGSGFSAFFSDALWTNAHVAEALIELVNNYSRYSPKAYAIQSNTITGASKTYELKSYLLHPEYTGNTNSADIALLIFDDELENFLDLLPVDHIESLKVGQSIGT